MWTTGQQLGGNVDVHKGLETAADDRHMQAVDGIACKSQAQTRILKYNTCSLCNNDMLVSHFDKHASTTLNKEHAQTMMRAIVTDGSMLC